LFRERTTGDNTGLIGIEVRGSNTIDDSGRFLSRLRKVTTFDDVFPDIVPTKERGERGDANGRNSRQIPKAFQGQAMKGVDLIRITIVRSRKNDRSCNKA
jgi:hypothetical protein